MVQRKIPSYRLAMLCAACLFCCSSYCSHAAYLLGIGDVLSVQVGGESALSATYTVTEEGTVLFPLLGAVRAAGLGIPEFSRTIRDRLAADYLVDPQVAVFVKEYRSRRVTILGDVPSPGVYYLKADSTLLSLLIEAGQKMSADNITITVTRDSEKRSDGTSSHAAPLVVDIKKLISPWQEHEPVELTGGERIFVKSGSDGKVIVSGRVATPGIVSLGKGLTALEAINQAGGVAEFGNLSAVRVVREGEKGSNVQTVDLDAVMKGDRTKDLPLQDGDIIVVPRRWF